MAASTRLGGPGVTHGANIANLASRGQNIFPQAFPTASVSVGQDDWATQVIDNVVGSPQEWVESREDILKKTIVEKKRLFHNNRFLELKNLPDGVTEQVNSKHQGSLNGLSLAAFCKPQSAKTSASRFWRSLQLLRDSAF